MKMNSRLVLILVFVLMFCVEWSARAEDNQVTHNCLLPPGQNNPRNSEGDFLQLKDGSILFVYSHFTGGGGDSSAAHLAGRLSKDGGKTWTDEDVMIVPNEGGLNVMSVSLLRLQNGSIAMFYLRKNSREDCRPCMRISNDEGETWSEPTICIPDDEKGYYVLNNDRAVQLSGGRIVLPVAMHYSEKSGKRDGHGKVMCYLSDDNGHTWRRGKDTLTTTTPEGKRVTTQEPGVVELKDGRLMIYCRTRSGCQYIGYSRDGGETWTKLRPSDLASPCSSATIERIPKTGDLLVVWNDHSNISEDLKNRRRPFTAAISKDEGRTWDNVKLIEDKPDGHYCYTAMDFVDDYVLLGHSCGPGLSTAQITRLPIAWLHE